MTPPFLCKHLPWKHENLGLEPPHLYKNLGMVVCTLIPKVRNKKIPGVYWQASLPK